MKSPSESPVATSNQAMKGHCYMNEEIVQRAICSRRDSSD